MVPETDHRGSTYQLLDFGRGRKLERIGEHILDRPSPAAQDVTPAARDLWATATSRYDAASKTWSHERTWRGDETITMSGIVMPVGPTPFGHLGVFPEQADNWRWLQSVGVPPPGSLGLNLFAYTGASTIAMARSGMHVAHVDAARPNVQSARQAAMINGLDPPPIRFLVDDALQFVRREIRRGRRYHTIVLDPPAYGHGPKGNAWRIDRDLWPLLDDCVRLFHEGSFRLLVTGHSDVVTRDDVHAWATRPFQGRTSVGLQTEVGTCDLTDASGRRLNAGFFVRFWI